MIYDILPSDQNSVIILSTDKNGDNFFAERRNNTARGKYLWGPEKFQIPDKINILNFPLYIPDANGGFFTIYEPDRKSLIAQRYNTKKQASVVNIDTPENAVE